MDLTVLNRMTMLRRQILLHAYIYYAIGDNIISDHEWDRRAQELYKLQQEHGWNINFYDTIFKKWEGQSGYWLPTNKPNFDENVDRVARKILNHEHEMRKQPDALQTGCGTFSASWANRVRDLSLNKELDKVS